jgi:hypothetical protein
MSYKDQFASVESIRRGNAARGPCRSNLRSVSPPRRTVAYLHDLGHKRDARVPDAARDFPAAGRWKDHIRRLKATIAVAARHLRSQWWCRGVETMSFNPELARNASPPSKLHSERTVSSDEPRAPRPEENRSVRPKSKGSDRHFAAAVAVGVLLFFTSCDSVWSRDGTFDARMNTRTGHLKIAGASEQRQGDETENRGLESHCGALAFNTETRGVRRPSSHTEPSAGRVLLARQTWFRGQPRRTHFAGWLQWQACRPPGAEPADDIGRTT